MTNRELLQGRAVELITELLNDAIQPDHDYCYARAQLRHEIAVGWQQHINDISVFFRELYYKSIITKLDEVGDLASDQDLIDVPAEDLLADFDAIRDLTENSFIAPVILLSAQLLNWAEITDKCIELFFKPGLMGGFDTTDAAVSHHRAALDWAIEMAHAGDYPDEDGCFDEE